MFPDASFLAPIDWILAGHSNPYGPGPANQRKRRKAWRNNPRLRAKQSKRGRR